MKIECRRAFFNSLAFQNELQSLIVGSNTLNFIHNSSLQGFTVLKPKHIKAYFRINQIYPKIVSYKRRYVNSSREVAKHHNNAQGWLNWQKHRRPSSCVTTVYDKHKYQYTSSGGNHARRGFNK